MFAHGSVQKHPRGVALEDSHDGLYGGGVSLEEEKEEGFEAGAPPGGKRRNTGMVVVGPVGLVGRVSSEISERRARRRAPQKAVEDLRLELATGGGIIGQITLEGSPALALPRSWMLVAAGFGATATKGRWVLGAGCLAAGFAGWLAGLVSVLYCTCTVLVLYQYGSELDQIGRCSTRPEPHHHVHQCSPKGWLTMHSMLYLSAGFGRAQTRSRRERRRWHQSNDIPGEVDRL